MADIQSIKYFQFFQEKGYFFPAFIAKNVFHSYLHFKTKKKQIEKNFLSEKSTKNKANFLNLRWGFSFKGGKNAWLSIFERDKIWF